MKREPKPILLEILVQDTITNEIILHLPPTAAGKRRAKYLAGLANIKIIEQYT